MLKTTTAIFGSFSLGLVSGTASRLTQVTQVTQATQAIQTTSPTTTRTPSPLDSASFYTPSISTLITEVARTYRLDPLLILAVIGHESHFGELVYGQHGEVGLMQIKPKTAEWIIKKYHLQHLGYKNKHSLLNASINIQIGSAYLHYLKSKHKKVEHYLAAYNLGESRLRENLKNNIQPVKYPKAVYQQYHQLKLISKNNLSRHLSSFVDQSTYMNTHRGTQTMSVVWN
jgi:soluble lytic murein transglycosylase